MCCNEFRRNQSTETRCSELSLALQVSVVYVRVLQRAFGSVGRGGDDWLYCVVLPAQCYGSEKSEANRPSDALTQLKSLLPPPES